MAITIYNGKIGEGMTFEHAKQSEKSDPFLNHKTAFNSILSMFPEPRFCEYYNQFRKNRRTK